MKTAPIFAGVRHGIGIAREEGGERKVLSVWKEGKFIKGKKRGEERYRKRRGF